MDYGSASSRIWSQRRRHALIPAMIGLMPMMFITRVRLQARTLSAISVRTFVSRFISRGCPHPQLNSPERVLHRLAALAHSFRVLEQSLVHDLHKRFMLPTAVPSLPDECGENLINGARHFLEDRFNLATANPPCPPSAPMRQFRVIA